MAKSKHKNKNKHMKRQKAPILSRPHYENMLENSNRLHMMSPYEAIPVLPETQFKDNVPISLLDSETIKENVADGKHSEEEIEEGIKLYNELLPTIITNYETLFNEFLNNHRDIDKKLNVFNIDYPHDIIDFSEYKPDKFSTAAHFIYDTGDTSLLWSTDEYIEIIPSKYEKFILHRKNFDTEKNQIEYELAYYMNINVAFGHTITLPLLLANFIVFTATSAAIDPTAAEALKEAADAHITMFKIKGSSFSIDICNYILNNVGRFAHSEKSKSLYEHNITQLIKSHLRLYINKKDAESNENASVMTTISNLFDQKISEAIACIIITNQLIREKRLSPPSKSKSSEPKLAYSFTNKDRKIEPKPVPEMKTRTLGDIRITSIKRPQSLTKERIVTYQLSQWGRKEHLRHLKSGKIIKIKAATVHRKCINAEDLGKKTTTTNTRYKIKGDKNNG